MSSVAELCLICDTALDPDEEVIRAISDSFDQVGGEEQSRKNTRYAHVAEEQQVLALGGWTVTGRGRLHDFPP